MRRAAVRPAGAACVTVVVDRECDIYDEFALRPANVELLIRCHHDRMLADGTRLYWLHQDLERTGPRNRARAGRARLFEA